MRIWVKKNWGVVFVGLFFLVTLSYIVVCGEGVYLTVHDYLDSHPAWIKMVKDNNLFFKSGVEIPFLGGIDRNYLHSDLKAYTWLFMALPVFPAIICGWYIKIFMSIAGFYFLAKSIYKKSTIDENVVLLCGFLYGIIPSYPPLAFAFASLPFLLFFMVKLYEKFYWKYLILLLIYPVLTDFSLFGIFICGYILCFFVIDSLITKKIKWRVALALVVICIGLVVTEWRLFYTVFFSEDVSIRTTFKPESIHFADMLVHVKQVLVDGYYHCGSLHKYVILPVCTIYFICSTVSHIIERNFATIYKDKVNWIFCWIIFNSIVYGLNDLQGFRRILALLIPPLNGFAFSRTIWFNPFLWYFAFMIILLRLKKTGVRYILLLLAFMTICCMESTYNHINLNIKAAISKVVTGVELNQLSYEEFYAEDLFEEIKKEINYNGEWSIAFGMHPSILEYNGIATLDGYLSVYPASYKEQFRKLIAPELATDFHNASYYDNWGGRAYIFSDEVYYGEGKKMQNKSASIRIDSKVFKEMDGKYIFSRVAIENASSLQLELKGIYKEKHTPYVIYVYVIDRKITNVEYH